MPQTDLAGACIFAERLRHETEAQMSVTISGGVAAAREGDTAETLMGRADAALYAAKAAGRNRVFSSGDNGVEPVAAEAAQPLGLI